MHCMTRRHDNLDDYIRRTLKVLTGREPTEEEILKQYDKANTILREVMRESKENNAWNNDAKATPRKDIETMMKRAKENKL